MLSKRRLREEKMEYMKITLRILYKYLVTMRGELVILSVERILSRAHHVARKKLNYYFRGRNDVVYRLEEILEDFADAVDRENRRYWFFRDGELARLARELGEDGFVNELMRRYWHWEGAQ